jgi:hypothetical protein
MFAETLKPLQQMAENYHRLHHSTLEERGTRSCKLETVGLLTGSDEGGVSLEDANFWTKNGTLSHSGQLAGRVIIRWRSGLLCVLEPCSHDDPAYASEHPDLAAPQLEAAMPAGHL